LVPNWDGLEKHNWGKGRKDKESKPREIGKRLLVVLKNQKPIWSSNYGSLKMNEPVKGSTLSFLLILSLNLAGSLISFFFQILGTGVLNVQILGIGRFFDSENPPKPRNYWRFFGSEFFYEKLGMGVYDKIKELSIVGPYSLLFTPQKFRCDFLSILY
jgi:hypothetical protein